MTPPMIAPLLLPPSPRPTTAPTAAPAAGLAMSPAFVPRPCSGVLTPELAAVIGDDWPLMLTDVGCSVRVPVVSLLLADSLIALPLPVPSDPAGMTPQPALSFASVATFAVTGSPA